MDEQTGSTPPLAQTLGLTERVKLTRFFSKLLDETSQFGCDSFEFKVEEGGLVATLYKSGAPIKSVPLKAQWFEPIVVWLMQHVAASMELPPVGNSDQLKGEFNAAVKLTNGFARFKVSAHKGLRSEKRLVCSALSTTLAKDYYEQYQFTPFSRLALDQISTKKEGLIIVSNPNSENLSRSISSVLNLTHAVSVSDFPWSQNVGSIVSAAETELIVLGVKCNDAIEAIWKLRELGFDLSSLNLVGSICQGFCPRVCKSCAKDAVIDASLTRTLPDYLKPGKGASYLVGRGCEQCNNSSYSGWIAIQNIVFWDKKAKELLQAGQDIKAVTKYFHSQGLTSLLEDGLTKAWNGLTCLEPLFKLVQVVPESFQKIAANNSSSNAERIDPISVADDYFNQGTSSNEQAVSSTQSQIFRGAGSSAPSSGNQPLFAVTKTGKVREKSLVLVVEDDPDQREILDMVFKSANYHVQIAADGVEALAKLKADVPDVIVTDLMMPNMDGLQLIRQLKANPRHQKIPVLVLTVISDAEKEYELLDVGADDYCEKTIQRKLLLKRVEKILQKH